MARAERSRGRKRTQPKTSTRTSRSSRRTRSRGADALSLLKDDHRKVTAMFDRFERTRGDDPKEKLANAIVRELKVHTQIEEEIFYPAAREEIADEDLLNEALVEHGSAKALIRQLEVASPSDGNYDALVKVLGEYIKHHVREEEGELFPEVRRTGLDLRELGERLKRRKQELAGGEGQGLIGRAISAATRR